MADKRSGYRVVGFEYILMGTVPGQAATASNYMPTGASLNTIGNLVPDSAHLLIDPETVNDFYVEEKAEVDCQIKTPGKKTIEFATRDMGPDMLAFFLGGAASGTTVYKAPQTASVVSEKSVRILTKAINGYTYMIEIPRASISVGGDLRFGKAETGTLTVSAAIMQPYSSCAPFKMTLTSA